MVCFHVVSFQSLGGRFFHLEADGRIKIIDPDLDRQINDVCIKYKALTKNKFYNIPKDLMSKIGPIVVKVEK